MRGFSVAPGDPPERITGDYTLSAASFEKDNLPEEVAKRLPHYPVPAAEGPGEDARPSTRRAAVTGSCLRREPRLGNALRVAGMPHPSP